MAWYAYCITERQAFPELLRHRKPIPMEAVTGIQGNQIFLYPASDLAVIVSEYSPAENLTQQAGVEHARVISDCFKTSTVLPFRFGTVFADDESLRRSIRSNQRQFITNIERLRGKAEMHLKVMLDDGCREQVRRYSAEPVPTVGRAYLTNLRESAALQRERQTKARAVTVQMHRMFLPLAEEVSCRRIDSGKMLLDIAHLIDSARRGALPEQILQRQHPHEGLPDAAFRPLAALPLRAPAHASHARCREQCGADSGSPGCLSLALQVCSKRKAPADPRTTGAFMEGSKGREHVGAAPRAPLVL